MRKLKVMAVGMQNEIIWDMLSEKEIPINESVYEMLNNEIDLQKWKTDFWNLYKEWLDHDIQTIFDIKDPINTIMINAIINYNKKYDSCRLYYWFDVNRDLSLGFTWQYCPLTGDNLLLLPQSYPINNRLISPSQPIVFPL